MKPNPVKQKLARGEVVLGTFAFEFKTAGLGRIAAAAGAEFIIYDMEHTGWTMETIGTLIASCGGADLTPIVRVPTTQYHFLARALDMGAKGVMVPMVESTQQVQVILDSIRYPPAGRRGAAFNIAHDDYQGGDVREKIRTANKEVLLVVQIETAAGLEHVEEIAAMDGVDMLWVGQTDMTCSLGIPAEFNHPKYLDALDRVAAAARASGKTAAFMALSETEARMLLEKGFRCLAYSGDVWIYQQALRSSLKSVRKFVDELT